jgi:RNA polymerase sigma-70 factor (ECF subfamily)
VRPAGGRESATPADEHEREHELDARRAYREHGGHVDHVAHRVLGRRALAEEATQETFIRAWRMQERIEPGRPLAPSLATIARRIAIDIHRREARRSTTRLEPDAALPVVVDAALMIEIESLDRLRGAIRTLAPEDAELIGLHHVDGLSYGEVGRRLGIAEGTGTSRSFRIHRELYAMLADIAPATGLHRGV